MLIGPTKNILNSFKKKSNRNIVSNIFTKVFTSFIALIFVPIYVSIIGLDYFGIIAIFTLISSIFGIFDLGISNSLNRLIAVNIDNTNSYSKLINQTKALEILYWLIGLILALIGIALSRFISEQLAISNTFPPERMRYVIAIFAILFFIQWPTNFYSAGLYGLQKHSLLNFSNIGMLLLRNLLGLVYLKFYDNSIEGFLIWQCIGYFVWTLTLFIIFHKVFPTNYVKFKFSFDLIKDLIPFAKGLFFISIFSVLITQFDKIILAKLLPIEQLGIYGISAIAASTVQYYAIGFYTAMFPKFSSLSSSNQNGDNQLKTLFNEVTMICAILTYTTMSIYVVYSFELIFLWTNNMEIVKASQNIIIVLTIATAFHSQSSLFLALQLSKKQTLIPIVKNIMILTILIPISIFFVKNYGVIGAAIAWLIVSALSLIFEPLITYKKILGKGFSEWFIVSNLLPLSVSFTMVYLISNILPKIENQWISLFEIITVFILVLITVYLVCTKAKIFMKKTQLI